MKNILILSLVLIHVVTLGQNNKDRHRITDTIQDLVIIHSEMRGQTNKEIERGYYKVLKIDAFNNFYLIFIEKNNVKSTIYSEKSIVVKGQKIEVDSTYFFELSCKDTLSNGTCLIPIANVTYFDKYSGYELGKLNLAKNLCGLIITRHAESSKLKQ